MMGWLIIALAVAFHVIALIVLMLAPMAAGRPPNNPLKEHVLGIIITAILVIPLVLFYRFLSVHIGRARRWAIVTGLLWTGFSFGGTLRMLLFVPMNQPSVVIAIVLCILNAFLFISLLLCLRSAIILHQLFRQHRELSSPGFFQPHLNDLQRP